MLLLDREWGGGLSDWYNRVMAEEKRGPKSFIHRSGLSFLMERPPFIFL